MFIEIVLYLFAFICISATYVYYKLTFWQRQGVPNDVASIYMRLAKPFHFSDMESHQKFNSKVVGFYEGLRPALSVADPEMIKKVLVTEFHNFSDHRNPGSTKQPIIHSIFFSKYPEWKRFRSILSPAFTAGKLKAMSSSVHDTLDSLKEVFLSLAKSGKPANIKSIYDSFSFDVISKTSFGVSIDSIKDPDNQIIVAAKSFFQNKVNFDQLLTYFYPDLAAKFDKSFFPVKPQHFLSRVMKQIIRERTKRNDAPDGQVKDFLQLMIDASEMSDGIKKNVENGSMNGKNDDANSKETSEKKSAFKKLTEEEVIANGINFFVAGHETTASTLSLATYCLALFPKCQKALIEEIDETFGGKDRNDDEIDQEVTHDKVNKMVYLDAFLNETLRFISSVARIERLTVKDTYLGDIFVPKGSMVYIPVWTVHLDPDFHSNPQVFDPQRFMLENKDSIKPYTFLPFALGPRNCIGMRFAQFEIKHALVKILIKFKFEASEETIKEELSYYCGQQAASPKKVVLLIKER